MFLVLGLRSSQACYQQDWPTLIKQGRDEWGRRWEREAGSLRGEEAGWDTERAMQDEVSLLEGEDNALYYQYGWLK